ncbi:SGNH/GDSL hydrolase family protein [Paenarthrobacter sp. TA1.8]|uniref:SGNH/GDSL hydrolase family protein n=1 Tax=Paenarthrobacter sp. TA1.8 TaxID=3400219 RepID=UPI003B43C5F6
MVSIIGDSYTAGSEMGGLKDKSWTALTNQALIDAGKESVLSVSGKGGSGYVQAGPQQTTFGSEVPKVVTPESDVIVFFGSRNDIKATPVEVKTAASAAYAEAKAIAPQAKLLVIGVPWTNEDVPTNAVVTNRAVSAAAAEAGATFIDPQAEGWFYGENAGLIGTDKVHPVDEGHIYMTKLIEPRILSALG